MWKAVPGYEGIYEASDGGSIKRVRAYNGRGAGRVLTQRLGPNGYLYVGLSRDNDRGKTIPVHKVIAATFLGPRPGLADICHIDGDKKNNGAANLRYDSRQGNMADALRQGRIARGERAGASKYTEAQVIAVRAAHSAGRSYAQIKKESGMPISTIQAIAQRKTWGWLT